MEAVATPEITFDDFLKVDIRAGQIVSAERVPKSEKLLKLQVDFGELGIRQIVAGIGKDISEQGLAGTKIVAVVNLQPRKLMGLESHGMILAGHAPDSKLGLVTVDAPNGTRIG